MALSKTCLLLSDFDITQFMIQLNNTAIDLLFLVCVNDIWKNIESNIRPFADDCVIYRKIVNSNDIEKLQRVLGKLREWVVENGMQINPGQSKAVSFTRACVKDLLNYSLLDQVIPEASNCKYLGIIVHSDYSWINRANYMAKITLKALHFTMCIPKKRK